jgi:hypothetical protein
MRKFFTALLKFLSFLFLFGIIGIFSFWTYERYALPTSMILNPTANTDKIHVGDILQLKYDVKRYKTCELHLTRIFKRSDGKEIQLQYVTQAITKDAPVITRQQGYQVTIPDGILDLRETKNTGIVFTRIQYFCNGLDYIFLNTIDQPPVPLTIYAKGVPFDE